MPVAISFQRLLEGYTDWECPRCGAIERALPENPPAMCEGCEAKVRNRRLLDDSGLPAKYLALPRERPDLRKDITSSRRGAFLFGSQGSGKTIFCSQLVADLCIETGQAARFIETVSLLTELNALTYKRDAFKRTLQEFASAPLLLLDDLGQEEEMRNSKEYLRLLFMEREKLDGCTTFITSNHTMDRIHSWSPAIASRIAGQCRPIKFDGPDRRVRPARS